MKTPTVRRIKALDQLGEGDLLVIAYKMAGNVYPIYKNKDDLIEFIVLLLNDAGHKLEGQTLPADLDVIKTLTPRDI